MALSRALTPSFLPLHIDPTLRQILTHSHSRVVMKALLHAHKRKRISVYVTEGGESKICVALYLTKRAES